jgi:hypothetical protein
MHSDIADVVLHVLDPGPFGKTRVDVEGDHAALFADDVAKQR